MKTFVQFSCGLQNLIATIASGGRFFSELLQIYYCSAHFYDGRNYNVCHCILSKKFFKIKVLESRITVDPTEKRPRDHNVRKSKNQEISQKTDCRTQELRGISDFRFKIFPDTPLKSTTFAKKCIRKIKLNFLLEKSENLYKKRPPWCWRHT